MHFNAIQMEEKNKALNAAHLGEGAKLNLGIDFDFYSPLPGISPCFHQETRPVLHFQALVCLWMVKNHLRLMINLGTKGLRNATCFMPCFHTAPTSWLCLHSQR